MIGNPETGSALGTGLVRKSLATQVYEGLESAVIHGRLVPGTRLGEDALAAAFAVSRSPVREAVMELERVGLAEQLGNRDRRVTVPTERLISEIFDVWTLLETERLYQASLVATPRTLAELDKTLRILNSKQRKGAERQAALQTFHRLLQEPCPNRQLQRAADDWSRYIVWFRNVYVDYHKVISDAAAAEHREIVRAFQRKDRAQLGTVMSKHLDAHRKLVVSAWARSPARTLAATNDSLPFRLEPQAA